MLFGATAVLSQDIIALGDAPAASFVVPYFASDTSDSDLTTLFSITNIGDSTAIAHVTLWTQAWQPTLTFDVVLTAHDIQTFSLTTLLNGSIPTTDPQGMPGCSEYSNPAFSVAAADQLKDDHTGRSCLGDLTAPIATGFITVDAVHQCTPLSSRAYQDPLAMTAISPGYFAQNGSGIAANTNQLIGDFHFINRQQNFAQGGTPIHLRADSEMFSSNASFYSFLSGGADNRSPLTDTIYGRFLNGGAFDGGTDMLIFRVPSEYVPPAELTCGQSPWSASETGVNMIVLDEDGNSLLAQRTFRWASENFSLPSWPELPTFGALELQFPDAMQGAGLVLQNANGRFSTGFDMTPVPRRNLDEDADGNPQGFRVDFELEVIDQQAMFQGQCFDDHSPTTCQNPSWFFGDGDQDDELNPIHAYGQGSVYSVTFVAEKDGAKASRTRLVTIAEPSGGGDDLSVTFTAVQTPETLNVQLNGSCFLGNQNIACQTPGWDFGDGTQGSGTTPTHAFPAAGTYTVTFTASANGQTDSQTMDIMVEAPGGGGDDLSVAFTAVQTPETLNVLFNGSCFFGNQNVACQSPGWDFGDGTQGSGTTPTHAFPTAGTYTVTFTASANGQTDSQTMDIIVQAPGGGGDDLSVAFTAVQTPETLNVLFDGSCFLGNQNIACQSPGWDFGDGTQGSGTTPTHAFPAAGTYTVTFTASANGQTDSQTMDIMVEAPGGGGDDLSVAFTAVQTPDTLGVQFDGACFLGSQTVACQDPGWDFGDGAQDTGLDPTHTFPIAGTYTVTFTASANGQTDSLTMDIVVEAPGGGGDDLSVAFTAIQTPETLNVQLNGSCFLGNQNVACQSPSWDFGDGTQGSGTTPTHAYPAAGTYSVTFTASANGQTDSQTLQVSVVEPNTPPVISGLACLPNPLIAGRLATCTFVVADVDGDDVDWKVTTDTDSNTCIEGVGTDLCMLSLEGTASGAVTIPFNLLSTAGVLIDAFVQVEAADERGAEAQVQSLDVVIDANDLPTITAFECLPAIVLPGVPSLCTLVFLDLNQDTVDWTVTISQGTDVCLDSNPGPNCITTIQGSGDLFPLTEVFQVRTSLTTPGQQVTVQATLDDGLDTVQQTTLVTIP